MSEIEARTPPETVGTGQVKPASGKLSRLVREELGPLQLRLGLAQLFVRLLPWLALSRLRTAIYRLGGAKVGPRTLIFGYLNLGGSGDIASRLSVGADCIINSPCFVDLSGPITLGNGVTIGHHTQLITAKHELHRAGRRAGIVTPLPIVVEEGAWVSAGVMVLPGVTIGHGAVVAAGAVVTADVAPNTLVGGIPARFIKSLPETPF